MKLIHVTTSSPSIEKVYRDFSNLSEMGLMWKDLEMTSKNDKNFPVRLHYMLTEMERDGLQHIVSWQPHGRCFIVHDQSLFTDRFLPLWFRQHKYASFLRQLNMYGFNRIISGPDKGAYFHELFLRGKQFLAKGIRRVQVKRAGARKQKLTTNIPDFYAMPFLPRSSRATPYGMQTSMSLSILRGIQHDEIDLRMLTSFPFSSVAHCEQQGIVDTSLGGYNSLISLLLSRPYGSAVSP